MRAVCLGALLLAACASAPPYQDYVIAHTALRAARQSEAPTLAARQWQQAQALYRQGVELYKRHKYDKAQEFFLNARRRAEQAENLSRLKKHRSNDL